MMKQLFYTTLLLSICALHGANKPSDEKLNFLTYLPEDIITAILRRISFSDDQAVGVYPIELWYDGAGDDLILPSSLRFTTLIYSRDRFFDTGEQKRTICTEAGHGAIPHMQCWVVRDTCSPYNITINNCLENTRNCRGLSWTTEPKMRFFDGINALGLAVYAESEKQYSCATTICFFEKNKDDNRHTILAGRWLGALLVHPERNNALVVMHDNYGQRIEISKCQPTGQHIFRTAARLPASNAITKMNCLGGDRYMGIYENGTLLFFELLHNTDPESYGCTIYNQRCAHKFKDAAVDLSCKTKSGLYSRIALMTEENKLFLCDLRYSQKPTLFYARTLENPGNTVLYYDENKVGVMHTNDVGKAIHFKLFPETYEGLYILFLLKHIGNKH